MIKMMIFFLEFNEKIKANLIMSMNRGESEERLRDYGSCFIPLK